MSRIQEISEKTLLPVSLVILAFGGVVWLTTMANGLAETVKRLDALTLKQEQYNQTVQTIDNRLNRIEGKLNKADQ